MIYKFWIKKVFFFNIIFVCLLMGINYVIDPFNIFESGFLKYPFQINERFAKIEYLRKNHQKYNSYIFGSSRIGTTNTSTIEKYIKRSKFYNLTVATASQYDNYQHLKYMIDHHYEIKNIYLQVDIKNFLLDDKPNKNDFLRKLHSDVLHNDQYLFYLNYLTIFPIKNIKQKLQINYIDHNKITIFDINNTGRWYLPWKDVMIEKNQTKFIENEDTLNLNKITRKYKNIFISENTKNLENFVHLCRKYNINLIVFTTPHNYNMMNDFDLESYYAVLDGIAKITNFFDFSGYNKLTCNNENYYEKSHYRSTMGEIIAKCIFKTCNNENYGTYVTSDNVEEYIFQKKIITSCDQIKLKVEK